MPSQETIDLASRAQAIYDAKLRSNLEATNHGDFVAVEPDSGRYFLGKTLSEARQAARAAFLSGGSWRYLHHLLRHGARSVAFLSARMRVFAGGPSARKARARF